MSTDHIIYRLGQLTTVARIECSRWAKYAPKALRSTPDHALGFTTVDAWLVRRFESSPVLGGAEKVPQLGSDAADFTCFASLSQIRILKPLEFDGHSQLLPFELRLRCAVRPP